MAKLRTVKSVGLWTAAACLLAVWAGSGCSVHLRFERGEFHSEKKISTRETEKNADLSIGLTKGGAGLQVACSGSWVVNDIFAKKFHKLDVRETYTPFLEIVEIPLAIAGPVIMGAVSTVLWTTTTPMAAFYLQGCVEDNLFFPWEKLLEDFSEFDDFEFGDLVLGIFMDAVGVGVLIQYIPNLITSGVNFFNIFFDDEVLLFLPYLLLDEEEYIKLIDPTSNYFSFQYKSETGEFYTEKERRRKARSGVLKNVEVHVTILGRKLRARTNADGLACFQGLGRDQSVPGVLEGTALEVRAVVAGYRLRKGGTWRLPPSAFLPVLALLEGSDWSSGPKPSRPAVTVTAKALPAARGRARLRIRVKNTGTRDLFRLRGRVLSKTREFDGFLTTFGRLRPGASVERIVEMPLPRRDGYAHPVLVEITGDKLRFPLEETRILVK